MVESKHSEMNLSTILNYIIRKMTNCFQSPDFKPFRIELRSLLMANVFWKLEG